MSHLAQETTSSGWLLAGKAKGDVSFNVARPKRPCGSGAALGSFSVQTQTTTHFDWVNYGTIVQRSRTPT
ncbi:hypothetical protein BDV26DRAFT_111512 [Aspergillus bertholletiae]|uniref:Uncharacterized protein n=1 Tax=Aspergillus bertholletiae TaxID=1226010 RepID=A0A5N7BGW0_9EURO|nr:hypothetical protein BDV26DRAFT_111512 [Aspergillus bertholletiae]